MIIRSPGMKMKDRNPTFTKEDIRTNADSANGIFVADLDGDGDLDIVSASANDDKIAWYQNNGMQTL